MIRRAFLFALAGVLAFGALPAFAQERPPDIEIVDVNTARYREDGRTTLVVQFQNFDSIDPSEVVVLEDGVVVPDLEVTTIEESAVDVGVVLLIDTSGSMRGEAIEAARAAARTFVSEKRPQDFISIITFDDEVTLLAPFTDNGAVLLPRIEGLEANGDTALYDALIEASALYRRGRSADYQPNIILLTDGADDGSQGSLETAVAAAQEVGARVFAIGLETPQFDAGPLQQIVGATDGLFLTTPDPEQLTGLYGEIKREIDNKLVLRFNARQALTTDVEFRVRYQGFQSTANVAVPGFVIREAATTTTVTFAPAPTRSVDVNLPLPIGTLALLGVGAVAIAVVALVFLLFVPAGDPAAEQFGGRLRAYGAGRGVEESARRGILDRIPFLRRFSQQAEEAARRRGFLAALNATLEQANIPLSAGEALVGGVIAAVLVGLVVGAVARSVIGGAVALVVALLLLAFGVQAIGNRERRRFEDQLPDTLTLLATSLRAGYSLLQAIEAVASETSDPTRREFGRAIAEIRLGRQVVDALEGIAERTQSEDFAWSVMAVEIQREVGGNLAEVLATVADTMLQRNRLRRDVRALTAEGRISAIILGSLPFALAGYLLLTNPGYLQTLVEDIVGIVAIVIGAVLMITGIIWLNRIVDIEI